jgi:hypothetical protein
MIPRIPTGEFSGRSWSTTNEAGKGSKPRNLSENFRDNYDAIKGFGNMPKSSNGHTRVIHRDGQSIAIVKDESGQDKEVLLAEPTASPKAEPGPEATSAVSGT